jgi:hypothetical protein
MDKKYLIRMTAAAIILAGLFFAGRYLSNAFIDWRQSNLACDAAFVVHGKKQRLSLMLRYVISGRQGIVTMKGQLEKDGEMTSVSRKSYFKIQRSHNRILATARRSLIMPGDRASEQALAQLLPAFYLRNDLKIEFSIYPQRPGGYIFSTGYVPSFYCQSIG